MNQSAAHLAKTLQNSAVQVQYKESFILLKLNVARGLRYNLAP